MRFVHPVAGVKVLPALPLTAKLVIASSLAAAAVAETLNVVLEVVAVAVPVPSSGDAVSMPDHSLSWAAALSLADSVNLTLEIAPGLFG
jgi:hypothetical protein